MKRFMLSLLFAACTIAAMAQGEIRVEAPNMVGVDEQFNLTFIIEGEDKPGSFSWTISSDFQLVWGPQKGSSTSINIVNGKRTKSVQYTYTYVLMPTKTGKFTLPAASATIKGKQISSKRAEIEVLSSGSAAKSQSSSSSGRSSGATRSGTADIAQDELFLRFNLSKTSAVIGEPIYATLKIYSAVNISGFEDAKLPSFNGFWSQETAPSQIQFARESVGGRIYDAALIRSYVIIPQQAGDLRIDPAELVTLVSVRTSRHTGSIFDDFFDNGYTTVRKRITTPAVTVHVGRLPDGAPASFGGGVGSYSISAHLTRDSLKTHDAASLLVTVSGKGNVSLLEAPKVKFPPDMDVYDTKVTVNSEKGSTSGSKTFEYPFIPRSHGDFTIEPVEYSYYDVGSSGYVTLRTGPIELHVAKGAVSESSGSVSTLPTVERKGVRNLGEDIRYISIKKPSMASERTAFVRSALYRVIAALMVLAALVVWLVRRKAERNRADVAMTRNKRAGKMAMGRLRQAREFMQKGLQTAFYEELHKALLGFASDKLSIGAEDLGKDSIASLMEKAGISGELSGRFTALLDKCEQARYSPEGVEGGMEGLYEEALNVISSIDSNMKGHKKGFGAALIALAVMTLTSLPSQAQDYPDSLWNAGVAAYENGLWDSAASAWESLKGAGIRDARIEYNLGNAYFKAGEYPKAILAYERALKEDPSMADARYNLDFANSLIQDRIDQVPEFIFKAWMRKVSYLLSSNAWAAVSLVMLALTLGMLLLFLLSSSTGLRKTGFFSAIVALLLCAGSLGFALWQEDEATRADSAIVMKPVSAVKSSPAGDTDLFVIHEGTKVRILDDVGQWKNISLADGRQGWIRSTDIEVI
ncbi:MAG: BatD family protein [Bacteroidales bacterium]|nr:BatD family protein [Bacteroidales bacterium]